MSRIRLVYTAVLMAIVAVWVGPNVAIATPMSAPAPDAFERYVAAHPYGSGVIDIAQAPDVFERYVAAHPYGSGVIDVTQAPDVFERYVKAHGMTPNIAKSQPLGIRDAWYDERSPDAVVNARDDRLELPAASPPNTLDEPGTMQSVEVATTQGFNWSDAGIGAAAAGGLILLMGASLLLLWPHRHRNHGVRAT